MSDNIRVFCNSDVAYRLQINGGSIKKDTRSQTYYGPCGCLEVELPSDIIVINKEESHTTYRLQSQEGCNGFIIKVNNPNDGKNHDVEMLT